MEQDLEYRWYLYDRQYLYMQAQVPGTKVPAATVPVPGTWQLVDSWQQESIGTPYIWYAGLGPSVPGILVPGTVPGIHTRYLRVPGTLRVVPYTTCYHTWYLVRVSGRSYPVRARPRSRLQQQHRQNQQGQRTRQQSYEYKKTSTVVDTERYAQSTARSTWYGVPGVL